ncbi:MAG TPA: PaaI family thioesterase [Acidimicrobiales bacterium]|nr:PaaI family thioesterase [Acidimicrobiales bacterium]
MTENRAAELAASQPFADLIGVAVISVAPERVVAYLEWTPERCTSGGMLHGGAMMSLADAAGGLVAFVNLPAGATGTTTVSSSTQFTRGLRQGRATATARPLHVGRTTIVVETDVRDDDDRLLARVTQTQAVLTG